MSAVFGGCMMILTDLVARTIVAPSELPVGAITALIGAPFFAYIYFSRYMRFSYNMERSNESTSLETTAWKRCFIY